MALLCNNYRDNYGTFKFVGATLSNNASPYIASGSNNLPGWKRNIFLSAAGVSALSSVPSGARHPVAWVMPKTAGGLASYNAGKISLSATGTGVKGINLTGDSTITLSASGNGVSVAALSGDATITLTADGALGVIAGLSGAATITLSGSATIEGIAKLIGNGTITLSAAGIPSAIGWLSGNSTNETEFSADALARAVWEALAVDFNTAGSMGEKLNGAASAGDPWSTALPGSYADGTAGKIIGSKLLTTGKFLGLK